MKTIENYSTLVSNWVHNNYVTMKRCMDILLSAVILIIFCPILVSVFILVKFTSEGSALFWSERRGLNGEPFLMPKFRTMTNCSKVLSRELATDNDITVTKLGHFLRKTSFDELPQLWSVFKGDMSLVGPRPLILNDYAENDRQEYPEIYNVKPGITGLAQVKGRNLLTPKRKTRYDLFYASRFCMILDMKILVSTLGVLFNTKLVK